MHYPGYLRYFDSAVRLLAERGHHVDVVFESPHKQPEGIEALAHVAGVEVLGKLPAREGRLWTIVARAVRGTLDYVRYLHPDFADSPYLRGRMETALAPRFSFFSRWRTQSARTTALLTGLFRACERAIPSSRALEAFIRARHPDAVVVTPLVVHRSPQTDVVKSAQALGIPTALCVASWDHLTTKGLMRLQPDMVALWNEEQKREAIEYHAADPARIVVTGAQPFDRWFERRPTDRASFCRKIGLDPARPFVLFVGSTASISAPGAEMTFVRRWIDAMRREPSMAEVGILVRPHPYNATHWREVAFDDLPNVAIYPRAANPVNEADRQDYFDSLSHSAAVVGVNTTAMIEAAIAGRTVHTVLADEFRDTQQGTLHFRYLLAENGGFLRVATSLDEHVRQIAETLRSPEIGRAACARFVDGFIRPRGRNQAATPVLVDALERLAGSGPLRPRGMSPLLFPLRCALWGSGMVASYRDRGQALGELRKWVTDWLRPFTAR
jgi:hypothetical protein